MKCVHGRCAVNVARTDFVGARMIRCGSGNLISELKNCFMCSRLDSVDLIVADEVHKLRNYGERAKAFEDTPARARLLLTATALPNNLDELYTLGAP